jgi:hypothetical protein
MKILINDTRKIKEIRDEFQNNFPYLKLEFFSRPHDIADLSKMKYIMDHDKILGECRKTHQDGIIEVGGNEKVWQLEQEFQKYGLPVQVFRKMKNNWIETMQTDWWTLEQQNQEGRENCGTINYTTDQVSMDNLDFNNL